MRRLFQIPARSCLLLGLLCTVLLVYLSISLSFCCHFQTEQNAFDAHLCQCMMGFSSTFVAARPASERGTPKHPLPQLLSRSRRQSTGCAQCLLLLASSKFTECSSELTDVYIVGYHGIGRSTGYVLSANRRAGDCYMYGYAPHQCRDTN